MALRFDDALMGGALAPSAELRSFRTEHVESAGGRIQENSLRELGELLAAGGTIDSLLSLAQ